MKEKKGIIVVDKGKYTVGYFDITESIKIIIKEVIKERLLKMITDKKIKKIIHLFAGGDKKGNDVCGYDTELYETMDDAIKAVRKILEEK